MRKSSGDQVQKQEQLDSDLPAGLAQPALRALRGAGLTKLEQLTKVRETELKQLHGIGPKAMSQLRQAMSARGLSFAREDAREDPKGRRKY